MDQPDRAAMRASAWADAAAAAARSGTAVSALHSIEELTAARAVWDVAWPTVGTEITGNLLRAIEHGGGYVSGAFDGSTMVAACLGLVARRPDPAGTFTTYLHSHMAATVPGWGDRGLGTALKLHQRAWALDHDLDVIEWSFDPLVRRNARLNLTKLGVTAAEYLVDFYGPMDDAVNADDPTDRLIVRWEVASERVADAVAGRLPGRTAAEWLDGGAVWALDDDGPKALTVEAADDHPVLLVPLPTDIVALRSTDPGAARAWRLAVRVALEPVAAGAAVVTGLTSDGAYVVERLHKRGGSS